MRSMDTILVVNINWLGDAVFSTPVFRALKEEWPEAKVVCLAVPRIVPIMQACPFVDEVIVLDEDRRHKGVLGKLRLAVCLRRYHFDAAFLLHRSRTRAFACYLAGIPVRVGFHAKKMGPILTHKVEPVDEQNIHRVDKYLRVIESFGVRVTDRTTALAVDEKACDAMKDILKQRGINERDFLVVAHLGANWDLKRWPEEKFSHLFDKLRSLDRVRVVMSGGFKDQAFAQEITREDPDHVINLVGQTKLQDLIALMAIANGVVSSDSGPLHIAAAVGTPIVAIFGPTKPELTGPRGRGESFVLRKSFPCNSQACYVLQCPIDKACVNAVSPDDVYNAVAHVYDSWKKAI